MHRPIRMPGHWFDELAAGGGSAEAVAFLVSSERARRLALLGDLLGRLEGRPALLGPADLGAIWGAVEEAEGRSPGCVEDVLLSPPAGGWLAHTLRRLHGSAVGPPLWVETGHLAAVALVAALRAGTAADLVVPARDGDVALPTLGLARLPGAPPPGFQPVRALVRDQELTLSASGRATGVMDLTLRPLTAPQNGLWWPTHRLPVRPGGPEVALDDTDPYRDLDRPVPPRRLAPDELATWRRRFDEAVGLLGSGPAAGSGPGTLRPEEVRRIVPWPGPLTGTPVEGLSASTGDAFGSMVVAGPPDGAALAETMVHEFQHSKLGALLHLFPMLDDDRTEEHYAPWRPDPRHLPGLLHGAYAFVGVAGFWRARIGDRAADPHGLAPFRFALRRVQTRMVLRTLATRACLTPPGRRLVAGLTRTVDGWLREPLDGPVVARARAAAAGHRVEWRLRNLRCAGEERAALSVAPRSGGAPVTVRRPVLVPVAERGHWRDVRGALHLRPDAVPDGACRADVLLVRGEAAAAREAYARGWADAPGDPHLMAGWLLAHTALHPGHRRLLARPERFAAAVAEADPGEWERAARWLAGAERRG